MATEGPIQSAEIQEVLGKRVVAFHYTSESLWQNSQRNGEPLRPSRGLIRYRGEPYDFPQIASEPFLFAFMNSPKPREWTHNQQTKQFYGVGNIWTTLISSVMTHYYDTARLAILGFDVLTTDDVYVVDWFEVEKKTIGDICAAAQGSLSDKKYDTKKYPVISDAQAWSNYIDSLTPLKEYQGTHIIPELVFRNRIDQKRVFKVGTINLTGTALRFNWFRSQKVKTWRQDRGI
jgi:hypothetical protein